MRVFRTGLLAVWVCMLVSPSFSQPQYKKDAAKFGLYKLTYPAFGAKINLGNLSQHLNFVMDGDLVLKENVSVFLDVSLRYLMKRQRRARPYLGAGAGLVLGGKGSVPAHVLAGTYLSIDRLPVLLELKIHLENPDALTLWLGFLF